MGKYRCGDRYCTDEELDMIEKVRGGGASVVEGEHATDLSGIGEKIEEAVSRINPSLEVSKDALVEAVSSALSEHPIQLVDTHSYEEHLQSCPHCQEQEEQRFLKNVQGRLPELAEKYGYVVKGQAKAEADPAPAAPEAEVKTEAKSEPEPEPAPVPPEGKVEETAEGEDEGGFSHTLGRIYSRNAE